MMRNILCILAIVLSLCGFELNGNTKDDASEIIVPAIYEAQSDYASMSSRILPPTPQSTCLARYGEHPVDLSTGLVDISLPIYNIQLGDFSLPISLSYHASGIRISDIATPVGLGWVLNAGGAISRTIISRPDPVGNESSGNEWQAAYKYRNYASVDSLVKDVQDLFMLNELVYPQTEIQQYDTEADRFTFNFAGHSGVMRFDHNRGEYIPLNYEKLNISTYMESGDKSVFRVIDANGYEYVFADHECSGYSDEATPPVTSWYISEIRTPWGCIKFTYQLSARFSVDTYHKSGSVGEIYEYNADTDVEKINYKAEMCYIPSISSAFYDEIILRKIEWDGHHIDFNYTFDREIRTSAAPSHYLARLNDVKVYNSGGECIHVATLTHTDWGSTANNRRTLLTAFNLDNEGTYRFSYNTYSGYLPDYVTSGCQDYRGYYNGATSGDIPAEVFDEVIKVWDANNRDHISIRSNSTGNRNPDAEKMQYGILTDVIYPAGGSSHFEYEPHRDDSGNLYGGLRIRLIHTSASMKASGCYRYFTYSGSSRLLPAEQLMFHLRHDAVTTPSGGIITKRYIIDSSPYAFMTSGAGCPVEYTTVTETCGGVSVVNGFKRAFLEDPYLMYRAVDFHDGQNPFLHCDMIPGATYDEGNTPMLLSSRTIYGDGNVKLYSESYEYEGFTVKSFEAGVRIAKTHLLDDKFWYHSKAELLTRDYVDYRPVRCVAKAFLNITKTTTDHTTQFSTSETLSYDKGL